MGSNRAPLLIVLLLLAGGGAWFTLGRGGDAPPAPATTDQGETPSDSGRLPGLTGRAPGEDATKTEGETGTGLVGRVTRDGQPVLASVRVWRISGVSALNPTRSDYEDGGVPRAFAMSLMVGIGRGAPTRTAQTDERGEYRAQGLAPGTYILWARDEARRMGFGHIVVPRAGLRQRVDITILNGPHELRARVLRREGEPYVGKLNLMAMGGRGRGREFRGPLAQHETDAQGRVTLPGLPAMQFLLAAFPSKGVIAYRGRLSLPHDGEFVWTLAGEEQNVKGRVIASDDKQPVSGAAVQVSAGDGEDGVAVDLTTDSQGRFETVLGAQARFVSVHAPGFVQAQMGVQGAAPIEVALVRTTTIRGRVLDKATKTALAGVRVLGARLGRQRGARRRAAALTDSEGRFVLDGLPAGPCMVFALGGGWLSDGLSQVEAKGFNPLAVTVPATGLDDLELLAVPAARVSGVVLDGAGQPVEGALVTPLRQGTPLVPGTDGWHAGTEGLAETDAQGRFVLDTLVPQRTYAFQAKHADKPTGQSDDVQVTAGEGNPTVEIRLPGERSIDVVVTDRRSGAAVVGARIRITKKTDAGDRSVEGQWFSGAEGRVNITGLPAAALEVRVEARRYLDTDPVPVAAAAPGGDSAPVTVLMDLGVEIRGQLDLPDGLKPGLVTIFAEGSGMNMGYADVKVSSDGTFLAEGVAPGKYELSAHARTPDGRSFEGSVTVAAPATDVRLTVRPEGGQKPPGNESGQVEIELIGSDGSRITQAKVTMLQKGSSSGTSIGQDGLARIRLRRAEEFRIQVRSLPSGTKGAPGTYGPYPGVGGRLRIQLDKGLPIAGRVLDEDGNGLKGVKIQVAEDLPDRNEWTDPFQYDRDLRATHTDQDGAFNLGSLKPGPHLLKVSAAKEFITRDPLSVDAGAADLRITLRRGIEARITVQDWQQQPLSGVWVSASVKRKNAHIHNNSVVQRARAKTNTDGVAVLQGLDPTLTYTLHAATNARAHPQCMPHGQEEWRARDETIQLPRAYITKGIARDLSGTPVAEATVWYRAPGASGASGTRTDKEGRFSIGPDAKPTLELRVVPPSRRIGFSGTDEAEWTRVEAGRDDVELSFDAGVSLTITVRPWNNKSTAEVSVREVGGGSPFGIRSPGMPPSGTLQLKSLKRDATYRIWISPDEDGNYVEEPALRGDAGQVTLTSKRGRTVSGTVTVPADLDVSKVDVQAYPSRGNFGQVVRGKVGKDGRYELRGVPEGDWSIQASWSHEFSIVKAAKIPADGRVDLVLERK